MKTKNTSRVTKEVKAFLGEGYHALVNRGKLKIVDSVDQLPPNLQGAMFAAAWHGSPHIFEKFSTENIGTGENAQSYGHGLYFASVKDVAEWYRDILSRTPMMDLNDVMNQVLVDGLPVMGQFDIETDRLFADQIIEGDMDLAIEHAEDRLEQWKYYADDETYPFQDYARDKAKAWTSLLPKLKSGAVSAKKQGSLYQVELAPEETDYLLWDVPFSQQSQQVQNLLRQSMFSDEHLFKDYDAAWSQWKERFAASTKQHGGDVEAVKVAIDTIRTDEFNSAAWAVINEQSNVPYDEVDANDMHDLIDAERDAARYNGEWVYHIISDHFDSQQGASEYLKSLGVRGIKYLDADSRLKGEGTYNYVLFDDADVEITALFSQSKKRIGVYHNGTIYLVANRIAPGEAQGLMRHEGLHLLLREDPTFVAIKEELMSHIRFLRGTDAKVREAYRMVPKNTPVHRIDEEALCYLVQHHKSHNVVQKIISAVKSWLLRMKVAIKSSTEGLSNFSADDLTALATQGIRSYSKNLDNKNSSMIDTEIMAFAEQMGITGAEAMEQYYAVVEQYKGTDQWMMAPNGEPTKLTEFQWVQTRTDAFKAWFGDWETAAKKGIWSFDCSKVVNRNGEPLVVYHGSENGGFTEFDQDKGHVPGTYFFSNDIYTARSYSGSLDDIELNTEDEDGDYDQQRGIYSVFLNIRTPVEENFEGANWDGQAPHPHDKYEAFDEDDINLFSSDGYRYMDEDEAEQLAEKNGGRYAPAGHYHLSTNDVARDALNYGDGAIIYEVVDSGPQFDQYDTSTVYIATASNQIKSATNNSGQFDPSTDDIRYSEAQVFAGQMGITVEEAMQQYAAVVEQYKDTDQWLKAPSGEPTRLTEQQWVQTHTEAFKAWFSDSAVVDENGEPRIGFRAMGGTIPRVNDSTQLINTAFDQTVAQRFNHDGRTMKELYLKASNPFDFRNKAHLQSLTEKLNDPDFYARIIDDQINISGLAEYIAANDPLDVRQDILAGLELGAYQIYELPTIRKEVERMGHDAIFLVEDDHGEPGLAVFSSEQIKSATDNTGQFNPDVSDILHGERSAPWYYSALMRGAANVKQNVLPAASWVNAIRKQPFVKQEEIDWSGITEWLAGQHGKISKEDILDYLESNLLKIKEVVHGGAVRVYDPEDINPDGSCVVWGEGRTEMEALGDAKTWVLKSIGDEEQANIIIDRLKLETPDATTKYHDYIIPNGKNYREILLALPEKAYHVAELEEERDNAQLCLIKAYEEATGVERHHAIDVAMNARKCADGYKDMVISALGEEVGNNLLSRAIETQVAYYTSFEDRRKDKFISSHWDEPNILAHMRLTDRLVNGEKVLFIEEIQSDWNTIGRKKGFRDPDAHNTFLKREKEVCSLLELAGLSTSPYRAGWLFCSGGDQQTQEAIKKRLDFLAKAKSTQWVEDTKRIVLNGGVTGTTPKAPFVQDTNWQNLALKRVMRLAAEEGYDRVSWVTGEQTADRYSLDQRLSSVWYRKNGDGTYNFDAFAREDGNSVLHRCGIQLEDVERFLGKEIASKMQNEVGELRGNEFVLEKDSLKINVGWARELYDKAIPGWMQKFGKKHGARLETIALVDCGAKTVFSDGDNSYEVRPYTNTATGNTDYAIWEGDAELQTGFDSEAEAAQVVQEDYGIDMFSGEDVPAVHQFSLPVTEKMRLALMEGQPLFAESVTDQQECVDDEMGFCQSPR